MSFFDFVDEGEKENFQITFPNVGEFDKETLLAFEKDTLGIYISGHPMEEYQEIWQKNVTAKTSDFIVDEDGETAAEDGSIVVIGGIGSISGSVIASFLFTACNEWWLRFLDDDSLGIFLFRGGFRKVVFAVVIMVIVLFFRQGLMGDKELPDKFRDWKAKLQRRKEKKKEAVK